MPSCSVLNCASKVEDQMIQNDPNKRSRIKYLLPWIGMAAVIGLMWAAFSE
jgi:hypothetical protein